MIKYGISQKKDGSMKIIGNTDANSANRQHFFEKKGIDYSRVVSAEIMHESNVKAVTEDDAGKTINGMDALVSNVRGLVLSVTVADCVPVYFVNEIKNVIGLAHVGWKGLNKGIIISTLEALKNNYPVNINNFKVLVGPHINACCYEVGDEVAKLFEHITNAIFFRNNKKYLSLKNVIKKQLVDMGIDEKNIDTHEECTYCKKDNFFSFRRDKSEPLEAQVAYIYIE